ncbi:transmembrane protein 177-like [Tubulanus polymorphus]|uniref:transmembrane protein 177-like n=1 Tax=Tubulanus polymorphus TaxID=672921 RepID=UPI003DA5AEFE
MNSAAVRFYKKYIQLFAGAGVCGICCAYCLPHTALIERYKSFSQLYPNGFEAKLDDHTKDLVQQVHDKILLKPEREALMKVYVCYGQDPIHAGAIGFKSGSLLGLPLNFAYTSVDQIDRKNIRLGRERTAVKWDTSAGGRFAESLIFSDDAKRFAIAREIRYLESLYVYANTFFLSLFGITTYWCGHALNQLLALPQRSSLALRLCMYGTILAVGYGVFVSMKDAVSVRRDRRVDRRAAELGEGYARGGVEYYEKLLMRNAALRELLGADGEKSYTPYGNTTQSWRLPAMTITSRLDHLREIVRNIEQKKNESLEMAGVDQTETATDFKRT